MAFTKIPAATNRIVDFTSSGTWVCPSGVYSAEFMVVGAGGGGGGTSVSSATFYAAGAGGGGGAVKYAKLVTIPGASYTITIGAKGTGSSGAVGGNGGYSEIVYSGTTLIRSFGGQGGGACVSDASTLGTLSRTIAGAGGAGTPATTGSERLAPGGGGASVISSTVNLTTNSRNYGAEGSGGNTQVATRASRWTTFGQPGIDGYGAGGSGGVADSEASTFNTSGASYFAGVGVILNATGATNGGAAVANTGCGGGGGASYLSASSTAGGNGADGLIRIEYFA